MGDLHAAPAAACSRLYEYGIARLLGHLVGLFVGRDGAIRARYNRKDKFLRGDLRLNLVANQANVSPARADKGDAMRLQNVGKLRVLRQKAVAGMNRIRAGDLAGGDDGGDIEIALACRGGAD